MLESTLTRLSSFRGLVLVAFLMGVAVMLMYKPFGQLEGGDDATWDYISQSVVRGQVPYRDVIENKAPGAAYLSAAVMAIGKLTGLEDVLAVRLFYVLLAGFLSGITFAVAEAYLRNRVAAVIAFIFPLLSEKLATMMISGTRPKVPMILFGMLTLLLIANDRPFWAGLCSMVSCLFWQPGLLFTGTAILIFSRYLTSWRDRRALRVLMGAAIPLTILLLYFSAAGALNHLWTWTVAYNYSVYMPEGREPAGVSLTRLWNLLNEIAGPDAFLVKLSIVGLLAFGTERLWVRIKNRAIITPPDLFKDALLIAPVTFLGFNVVNYPGADNLIVLFPLIGTFVGFFFLTTCRLLASLSLFKRYQYSSTLATISSALLIALIVARGFQHGWNYRLEPGRSLKDQQREIVQLAMLLKPDDKLYVHGALEVLVLLNRPNMNPYIFLARGVDRYVGARTPGGFEAIVEQMKSDQPRVIAISRIQNVYYRDALLEWAAEEYDRFPMEFAHNSVYVRKQR